MIKDTGNDDKQAQCSDENQYEPVSATPINQRKVKESKEPAEPDKNLTSAAGKSDNSVRMCVNYHKY